jgi:hypothetical protein
MRNLSDDNRKRIGIVRNKRSSDSPKSPTFKRDTQLLETLIVKKLEESPVSSGNLAATLFDDHFPLIERLTPFWQQREVLRAIRRIRRELGRQNASTEQYPLPGFEGIPERVRINGRQPRFGTLTYAQTLEYLRTLKNQVKTDSQLIANVEKLLSLMKKHATQEPDITVREVCEREHNRP